MSALRVAEPASAPPPAPPAPPAPPTPSISVAPSTDRGVYAVVLYDYEAAEENEMQLVEGETIEQIEQIDEGESAPNMRCSMRPDP